MQHVLWLRTVVHRLVRASRPAAAAALLLTYAPTSGASVWEVFGFGPEGVASVSAQAATANDGTSVFYNPGGLAMGRGTQIELSGTGMLSWLEAQGATQPIHDPAGGSLAVGSDVPLEGPLANRLRVGFGAYALPSKLMRLQMRPGTDPFFPYYDNRTQRLTVIPAVAVRLASWIGVGVGANVLAGVSGPVDVREGQSRGLETLLQQDVRTVAGWVAGLRVAPVPGLDLALAFRQRFGVPFHVITTANVAGVPLRVDVDTAEALYDPAVVVVAGAVQPSDRVRLELDGSWSRWSAWRGPLLSIDTTVSALSLASHSPEGLFRDTWAVRGAGHWWFAKSANAQLGTIAGAGYETSMLDTSARQGRTNFIDGPKLMVGAGTVAHFPGLIGRALSLSVGAQWQRVAATVQDKQVCTSVPCAPDTLVGPDTDRPGEGISNPGYPTLRGHGGVFVLSVGARVEL